MRTKEQYIQDERGRPWKNGMMMSAFQPIYAVAQKHDTYRKKLYRESSRLMLYLTVELYHIHGEVQDHEINQYRVLARPDFDRCGRNAKKPYYAWMKGQ